MIKFLMLAMLLTTGIQAEFNASCQEKDRDECSYGFAGIDPSRDNPRAIANCLSAEKEITCLDKRDQNEYDTLFAQCTMESLKFNYQSVNEKINAATSFYLMGCLMKEVKVSSVDTCGCDL